MPDTVTPPQGRAEEILQAAARVFRERGYHGGTLEEVGARLGITRAALYYYFRNKQAVLAELLTRAMHVGVADLEAAIASSDDPEEQLTTAIASLIDLIARERDIFTIYFQENEAVMSAAGEESRRLEEQYAQRFTGLVREVLDARGVEGADAGVIARGLLGMCNWTYRWLRPGGPLSPRDVATQWSAVFSLHQRRSLPARRSSARR
ncbi:MAG TPA: TetR/AcrR family transcriptional regulator [Candidatus Dormibacteraeota bacterium]|jgi:AcrR family transcriptional regulator